MRTLDDILTRMQAHQSKKRPLLRALRAWSRPDGTGAPGTRRARKAARCRARPNDSGELTQPR
jgi:hypothetical protein